MLLQPRPTSLSPVSHLSSHHRSSSFTSLTPSINASSTPTSPQAPLKRTDMIENVPSPTPSLQTITVVSVASHPLPQQNAVRIDMKLRIPISFFTPTQQAALATVKQHELIAIRKRKQYECTLNGCTCVSCKEEPIQEETSEITTPPPEIVSIASATSAFKKLKSSSTPSSPPFKSTSIPSSPPSSSPSTPSSPPSKSTSVSSSPYDDDHLSLLDLPMTFRNHKSWYANPFNTKRPPKPIPKIFKHKNDIIGKSKDGETHLSPPTSITSSPRTSSPSHSLVSTGLLSTRTLSPSPSIGLLSTDYVYRDVNVVIPATSSMDVAIQVHKQSVKIRCGGHTLVTLNAHHLFTF